MTERPLPLIISDNNPGQKFELDAKQRSDLEFISDKTVAQLIGCNNDNNLLIFPDTLDQYGDNIGESIVLSLTDDTISSNNLMGFIGRGDTMMKIRSRFDSDNRDFFMHYLLEKVFSLNLFDLPHASDVEEIFDFIQFLFPYFLNKAMAQGLYRQYVTYKRNDSRVRGPIDTARHIKANRPFNSKIAYTSRELTADNDLMHLISHTIEHIRHKAAGHAILSRDEETWKNVMEICHLIPSSSRHDRHSAIARNLRPNIHPYYSEYEPLRRLCLHILREEEIKYGEDDKKVYGILFDGAWLWEEYLAVLFNGMGITHPQNRERSGGIHLFTNPQRAVRYPDFYAPGIVIDAKYKGYAGKEVTQIGRDDLAQVISYMHILEADKGCFIVPGSGTGHLSQATLTGRGGIMALLSLPIPSQAPSYGDFRTSIAINEEAFLTHLRTLGESEVGCA